MASANARSRPPWPPAMGRSARKSATPAARAANSARAGSIRLARASAPRSSGWTPSKASRGPAMAPWAQETTSAQKAAWLPAARAWRAASVLGVTQIRGWPSGTGGAQASKEGIGHPFRSGPGPGSPGLRGGRAPGVAGGSGSRNAPPPLPSLLGQGLESRHPVVGKPADGLDQLLPHAADVPDLLGPETFLIREVLVEEDDGHGLGADDPGADLPEHRNLLLLLGEELAREVFWPGRRDGGDDEEDETHEGEEMNRHQVADDPTSHELSLSLEVAHVFPKDRFHLSSFTVRRRGPRRPECRRRPSRSGTGRG